MEGPINEVSHEGHHIHVADPAPNLPPQGGERGDRSFAGGGDAEQVVTDDLMTSHYNQ